MELHKGVAMGNLAIFGRTFARSKRPSAGSCSRTQACCAPQLQSVRPVVPKTSERGSARGYERKHRSWFGSERSRSQNPRVTARRALTKEYQLDKDSEELEQL